MFSEKEIILNTFSTRMPQPLLGGARAVGRAQGFTSFPCIENQQKREGGDDADADNEEEEVNAAGARPKRPAAESRRKRRRRGKIETPSGREDKLLFYKIQYLLEMQNCAANYI